MFSYAIFRDLERAGTALSVIAAHRIASVSLGVRNEPTTGEAVMVSGS